MRDRLIANRYLDLVSGVEPAHRSPHVRVLRGAHGRCAVLLRGEFPDRWCSRLSLGLSRAGVGIIRGFARRVRDGGWVAEFQVLAESGGVDPGGLDHLALALEPVPPSAPPPITIDSYYVDGSPESGAHVFLEVRGRDRVGFLGSLLERLATMDLFPDQMSIETWEGLALDTFHLRPGRPGGRLRSEEAARELSEMLEELRLARLAPRADAC
jgi:hypothetical protein